MNKERRPVHDKVNSPIPAVRIIHPGDDWVWIIHKLTLLFNIIKKGETLMVKLACQYLRYVLSSLATVGFALSVN